MPDAVAADFGEDPNRAALVERAKAAPAFAHAVHRVDAAPRVGELLDKRTALQATALALHAEWKVLAAQRQSMAAKREERDVAAPPSGGGWDAGPAARAVEDNPDVAELMAKVLQQQRTLRMHRALTREVVLASGRFWGDGAALQRAVTGE